MTPTDKPESLNTFELEHIITALKLFLDFDYPDYPANEAPDMTITLIDRFEAELEIARSEVSL